MKFRITELFLGVFLTVAIFAMGFLFASSLPSNNQQATESSSHQAEKSAAHITGPNSPDERIANYTWWLSAFTLALVVVSGFQIFFLTRADKTARISADAAKDSAEVAKAALVSTQRAFVFLKKFNAGFIFDNGTVHHIVFHPEWENGGATPARNLKTWTGFVFTENTQTIDDIEITDANRVPVSATVMGPKIVAPGSKIQVSIGDAMTVWRKERRLFLWALVEYQDIFESSKARHTQISAEVVFGENPSGVTPTNFSNNTLEYRVIGNRYNSAE